jgi:hypothetical protein
MERGDLVYLRFTGRVAVVLEYVYSHHAFLCLIISGEEKGKDKVVHSDNLAPFDVEQGAGFLKVKK